MKEATNNFGTLISIISLGSSIALICSIAYNYAYFWYFGLVLAQVPLTVSDVINSALAWAPWPVAFLFLSLLFRFIIHDGGVGIVSGTCSKLFYCVIAMSCFSYLLIGQSYNASASYAFGLAMLVWLCLFSWIRKPMLFSKIGGELAWGIMIYFPLVVGFALSLGYDAAADAYGGKMLAEVWLSSKESHSLILLRNFEKGVLFKNPSGKEVIFLNWSRIYKISTFSEKRLFYAGFLPSSLKRNR